MSRRTTLILFSLAVGLQAVIVALVPAGKYLALSRGRPLVLKLAPVDPYSMMSGYYAALNYEVSSPSAFKPSQNPQPGDTVYAVVRKGEDGAWHPETLLLHKPSGLSPEQAFLRGTFRPNRWGGQGIVYGIESFYIPEEDREDLNRALARRWEAQRLPPPPAVGPPAPPAPPPPSPPSYAEVKVDGSGRAALVALRVGDKRFP
jgi:uncharacterized membrane-anchored protein